MIETYPLFNKSERTKPCCQVVRQKVNLIKEFLTQLVDNYDLPVDLVNEIKDIIENESCKADNDESKLFQGHDFLAQLPLSPKRSSNASLDDLSSTFWSGKLS